VLPQPSKRITKLYKYDKHIRQHIFKANIFGRTDSSFQTVFALMDLVSVKYRSEAPDHSVTKNSTNFRDDFIGTSPGTRKRVTKNEKDRSGQFFKHRGLYKSELAILQAFWVLIHLYTLTMFTYKPFATRNLKPQSWNLQNHIRLCTTRSPKVAIWNHMRSRAKKLPNFKHEIKITLGCVPNNGT